MKCIILCAGHNSSLLEENENIPKALLTISNGKTILDYTVEKIENEQEIDEIWIATNNKYVEKLEEWRQNHSFSKKVTIINDTTNNSNEMLGAIGDIVYTINYANIKDDVMVVFGDNLFDFSFDLLLKDFYKYSNIILAGQRVDTSEQTSDLGMMEVSQEGKLLRFEEKVDQPEGEIKSLGIYLFPQDKLSLINQYLSEGNPTEAPGYFIHYLQERQVPIYVTQYNNQKWFKVRSLEDLMVVRDHYIEK